MPSILPATAALPPAPTTGRAVTEGAPEAGGFAQALGDAVASKPDGPTAEGGPSPADGRAQAGEAPTSGNDDDAKSIEAPPPAPTEGPNPAPDGLAALLAQLQPRSAPSVATRTSSTASSAMLDGDGLPQAPRKTSAGNALPVGTRGTAPGAAAEPQGSRFADRLAEAASHPTGTDAGPQAAAANASSPSLMAARSDFATLPSATPAPASSAAAAGPSLTTPATPVEARLPAGPASADFGAQISAQVTTFVRAGVEHARLHLNPADLGPVQVQIQVEGNTAAVHLSAEHAQTRQALEQALPQLASSLREAGLTLTGGGVSHQQRQGAGREAPTAAHRSGNGSDGAAPAAIASVILPARRRGVVDLVA